MWLGRRGACRIFLKGGGGAGTRPRYQMRGGGGAELLEALKAPKKFFGLN